MGIVMMNTASGTVYVLLGDTERSREMRGREGVRKRLDDACRMLNARHAADVAGDAAILKGVDEVGAVLRSPRGILDMVTVLDAAVRPHRMRFVLARGVVEAGLGARDVARMSGPVFDRASELMESLKKEDLPFRMEGGDGFTDKALSGLMSSAMLFRQTRSARQQDIIAEYVRTGSQQMAARELGVSQQAVSQAVVRSGFRQMRSVEQGITELLEEYGLKLDGGGQ